MRVCLIQPPASYRTADCCLPADYVGLGLLAVKEYLAREGHEVEVVHAAYALAQGRDSQDVVRHVADGRPDLVAVSCNWLHLSVGALETAKGLQALAPGIPVVLGGQHASIFAEEILRDHGDLLAGVVLGEAERPLVAALERLASGDALDGIPGLLTPASARDGAAITAPEVVADVDTLPHVRHTELWPGYPRAVAAVSTMRGTCRQNCNYCLEAASGPVWKRAPAAWHSVDWIAEQVAVARSEGLDIVTFEDPFFLRGDADLEALVQRLAGQGPGLFELNLFTEPHAYSDRAWRALAGLDARQVTVDFGIETGSPTVARALGRRLDPTAVLDELHAVFAAGLVPYTWWLVGLPGEGPEEVAATRELLVASMRAGAVPRWITPLVLFPGTRLFREAERHGVRPRFTRFRHFARFSDTPRDPQGLYPTLLTHETDRLSREQILGAVRELKQAVADHWPELEAVYRRTPAGRRRFEGLTQMLTKDPAGGFDQGSFF